MIWQCLWPRPTRFYEVSPQAVLVSRASEGSQEQVQWGMTLKINSGKVVTSELLCRPYYLSFLISILHICMVLSHNVAALISGTKHILPFLLWCEIQCVMVFLFELILQPFSNMRGSDLVTDQTAATFCELCQPWSPHAQVPSLAIHRVHRNQLLAPHRLSFPPEDDNIVWFYFLTWVIVLSIVHLSQKEFCSASATGFPLLPGHWSLPSGQWLQFPNYPWGPVHSLALLQSISSQIVRNTIFLSGSLCKEVDSGAQYQSHYKSLPISLLYHQFHIDLCISPGWFGRRWAGWLQRMQIFLYIRWMERKLVQLPAADGLSLNKLRRLFICADSFSVSATSTTLLFLHRICLGV